MPAVDALALRTVLHEQIKTKIFRDYIDRYAELEAKDNSRSVEASLATFGAEAFERALNFGENFYVAPDMHALAMLASEDFPDDENILIEDLPSHGGLMFMPQRFRMFELRGRLVVIHAVLWLGSTMWLISDLTDPDDEISAFMRHEAADMGRVRELAQQGRYDICGMIKFSFGKPVPKRVMFPKSVLPPEAQVRFQSTDQGVVMYTDHVIDNTVQPRYEADPLLMFMLAVWRLMQQTLADVRKDENMPRPARRRAERYHVPTAVTVIQLRRREGHYESTGQSINYRTLVRGHWRRVWCGPLNGERYRRAVYVHEFIRGPEDAPLIIRKRVNALVR